MALGRLQVISRVETELAFFRGLGLLNGEITRVDLERDVASIDMNLVSPKHIIAVHSRDNLRASNSSPQYQYPKHLI